MTAKLYVILGSHACRAGILMLDHKGVDYRLVTLPTGLHPVLLRMRGFRRDAVPRRAGDRRPPLLAMADRLGTVPALRHDGHRVETNRDIARYLDEVRPDPALFPEGSAERAAVEEAERWGDEVFQMTARRLGLAGVLHGPDAMVDRARDGRLGPMLFRHDMVRFLGTRFIGRTTFATTIDSEAELLRGLPEMLDRIDGYIGDGVLNGSELNAADFLIAPSVALLTYRRDLVEQVEDRPVRALIDRLLPAPG